ncbi:hypothetical protein FRX31_022535 [Thalictrum thalictroides]|uniref:Uncharacterized protein n=1 Tax=Thalictrum thalictroides TaxID=46969 RepID=A0A7J6VS04_THATH|nr:hypothetical protein FRX31_022535 [Thalictrum thalictroides]
MGSCLAKISSSYRGAAGGRSTTTVFKAIAHNGAVKRNVNSMNEGVPSRKATNNGPVKRNVKSTNNGAAASSCGGGCGGGDGDGCGGGCGGGTTVVAEDMPGMPGMPAGTSMSPGPSTNTSFTSFPSIFVALFGFVVSLFVLIKDGST